VLAPPQVEDGERTGWRVSPGDADALARAIGAALSLEPSAREAMARQARTHVERHFSLDRMVGETLQVYADLLGRASCARS
jgi:glycosyltransferase involved in cell wall biosynthesis